MNDPLNQADFQEISRKGQEIYQSKKLEFDPAHTGKFLAIETETKEVYLGETSAEALEKARQANPGKIFYVVKIGSNVAETMALAFADIDNK